MLVQIHVLATIGNIMIMSKAIAMQEKIAKKEKICADLLVKLGKSLAIQQIWPEAFKAGSCKFSGRLSWDNRFTVKGHSFISAWFERADSVRYYLSAEQLAAFKPEVAIHRDYREVSKD